MERIEKASPQQYGDDLTPEQQEAQRRASVFASIATTTLAKLKDTVAARSSSGIESEWTGDDEFYEGFDDANRGEFSGSRKSAPTDGTPVAATGSTVFPNITQPYVDAAAARVGDMLLPTDDRNFGIEPTPIPDLFAGLEQAIAANQPKPAAAPIPEPNVQAQGMGVPGMPQPAQQQVPQQPGAEPQVDVGGVVMAVTQAKARFDAMKAEAKRAADKAQEQIDDWLTECQYHAEMRKVIDDAARLGSGVIKGPVPVKSRATAWAKNPVSGVYEMQVIEDIVPASFRVDPWDLFPDPACGESIHRGDFVFERDRMTRKCLEDLKGLPGYLDDEIDQCLKEGPKRAASNTDGRSLESDTHASKSQFVVWYYHGTLTADELRCAGLDEDDGLPNEAEGHEAFPAIITLVNDRVIRASLNPMDDGQFPYDVIPWKRRAGMPWGMGVSRQMRTPQRIVVAATRNLMDNAGLAAGPQLVLLSGVEPANGKMEIRPLKLWKQNEDAAPGAATSPLQSVVIPMLQNELMAIIQFGMKMAEDVTGLPALLQGQQGAAPETVGGMTILNNNANSVMRRLARLFDSSITEPHIRRYYTWLMQYSENDEAKGDCRVVARGSTALVERDIQGQEMLQLVQLSLNPAFELSPARTMREFLKTRRFDPDTFTLTDEEKQQMAQQQAPEDPRITAEKMRAEHAMAMLQAKQAFDAEQADKDRAFEEFMAKLTADLGAQLDERSMAGEHTISMESIKAMIAATSMKLQTEREKLAQQRDLSYLTAGVSRATPQVSTPPTEPAGQAEVGMAYQA